MIQYKKHRKNKKIKVAIVGCGRISKNHILAICGEFSRSEIVAFCDVSEKELKNKKDFYLQELKKNNEQPSEKLNLFECFESFIDYCKMNQNVIDLIILCTPSGHHSYQTIKAAKCKVNVCTEKPMATLWADGLKMVKACNDNDVNLFVVKQNRFNSTLQLLKKQIDKNRFGRIYLVTINVFWHRPQSYYDQGDWRGTWKLDGGALMNQASHYVDLIDWLFGSVSSVSANIATLGRIIEAEDTATVQIKWEKGTLGTMNVTMLTYPKNLEGSITILGEKGTVKLGGNAVNQILHWEFEDNSNDDKYVEKANYETTSIYGFGHPLYYKNMLDVLEGKATPYCDGNQGLKSLEIISAAYKSAFENSVINLPLER